MPGPRNSDIDAFFEKALSYEGDECLLWPFSLGGDGYAQWYRAGNKYGTIRVLRAICIEAHGKPPTPKHQAAHAKRCLSKACINKWHLRWATRKENMADDCRGEDNHNARLTEDQVLEIRRLYKSGERIVDIARQYNVSRQAIRHIIKGTNWSWLDEPCDAQLLFDSTRPKYPDLFA
jgi:Helix-turn-helix domain of resolvase